jgi:hypothetical protein
MLKGGSDSAYNETKKLALSLCVLAMYAVITVSECGVVIAQDKSTSINCTDIESCEKTECINGDCETTVTNSSNISSSTVANDNSDRRESIADHIEERLRLREH